jgi:GDP/UDP-N,N'-diacetylbacillosamine 2-epimerase (hydrolysing)
MNIAILTGCDSDKHLSDTIYDELKLRDLKPVFIQLTQNNIIDSYHTANYYFKSLGYNYKYDFVLAVGDRPEQIGGVLSAFQNKVPIGHLYAGDYNTVSTFDDIHRHAITLYSNIQFCSCKESKENTIKLMQSAGLVPNANVVGATHFNNININKLPKFELNLKKPYVLMLINSETLGDDEKVITEAIDKFKLIYNDDTCNLIIAKGNGDNNKLEKEIHHKISNEISTDIEINMLSRLSNKDFIYLMINCDSFITNSSAAIYEAPALIEKNKIILIGNRNKGRTKIPITSHDGFASSRVANLIKTFLEAKL